MAIDWRMQPLKSPVPELASIGETLDLIAQRRMRMYELAQQREMEEARVAEQRAAAAARLAAEKEAARLKAEDDLRKERAVALPKIAEAVEAQRPEMAGAMTQLVKGEFRPAQWERAPVPEEPAGLGVPAGRLEDAAALAGVSPEATGEVMAEELGARAQGIEREAAIAENVRREREARGRYEVRFPGAEPIFMSELAGVQSRLATGAREVPLVQREYGPVAASYDKEYPGVGALALKAVTAKAAGGQMDKESLDQTFREVVQQGINVALAKERSEALGRRAAGAAGERAEKGEKEALLSAQTKWEATAGNVLKRYGFSETMKVSQNMRDTLRLIEKGGPGAVPIIVGRFVRLAQGPGVLSNQDIGVFWGRMGGIGLKTWGKVEEYLTGDIPQSKKEYVIQALKELALSTKERYGEVEQAMSDAFDTEYWQKIGGNWKAQAIRAYVNPSYGKAEGAKPAGPATAPAGKAPRSRDDVRKALGL